MDAPVCLCECLLCLDMYMDMHKKKASYSAPYGMAFRYWCVCVCVSQ